MSRDHSLIFFLFILSAPFDVTCESDQFSDLLSFLDNNEDLFNTSASEPEIPTDMLMDQTEPIPSEKNQVSIENPVELSASKQTYDSEYQDQLSVSTQTDVSKCQDELSVSTQTDVLKCQDQLSVSTQTNVFQISGSKNSNNVSW